MELKTLLGYLKYYEAEIRTSEFQIARIKEELGLAQKDEKKCLDAVKNIMLDINELVRQGDESVYFDKFEQDGATIKVRKLPASALVQDEDKLSNDFVRVTKSADKKAIKTALDAGEEVEGAELSAETYKLEVSFDE